MRWILISLIRIYWRIIPSDKRRKCVFKISCSRYVFKITTEQGFLKGIKALKYRYDNCRSDCTLFIHPVNGSKQMLLPSGDIIEENEIAENFMRYYSNM